jgi:phosphonoacetaldehyde hydrolase
MQKLKAVIFDWAGTTIDFGSFAPMGAFVEAFAHFGVPVTVAQARVPMGLPKRDHISAMVRSLEISEAWQKAHGRAPSEKDIDEIYRIFVPMNEGVVASYAGLIPGTRETAEELRTQGIRIGSTTGYTRSIMERVLPLARSQGYAPDNLVCADDMPRGRPSPMNMYRCFIELDVWPAQSVVKVDDTEPGIAEGVAAGCLTVGVALSGNSAGISLETFSRMTESEKAPIRRRCSEILKRAGADYVIDTVADLLPLLQTIGRL